MVMLKEIYGKKIGMTQIFDEEGALLATTLLEVEPAYILEKIEHPQGIKAKIGCFKIQDKKLGKVKKPVLGYFKKLGVAPCKLIREVAAEQSEEAKEEKEAAEEAVKPEQKRNPGEVGIEIFNEGDIVDVRAKSKGKGFAGGMKKHNWSGQPGSHGSTMHRRPGSIGASAYPSKVIKGRSMPGHLGNVYETTKNLKILKIDKEKNILFIQGSIPGARGAIVRIRKVK